jgi:hypothetical protein
LFSEDTMATLWYPTDAESAWRGENVPLESGNKPIYVAGVGLRLVPFGSGRQRGLALLAAGPGVWLSGEEVVAGLAVLDHQDEILIDGQRVYYSADGQPEVSIHASADPAARVTCPVCRTAVVAGQAVVVCPRCSRVHHQIEAGDGQREKRCWTFHAQCHHCGHPTSLDGSGGWRPDNSLAS